MCILKKGSKCQVCSKKVRSKAKTNKEEEMLEYFRSHDKLKELFSEVQAKAKGELLSIFIREIDEMRQQMRDSLSEDYSALE